MLVLSRKKGESIIINDEIELTILSVEGDTVKLGISAPLSIDIYRKEVYEAIKLGNQSAAVSPEMLEKWLEERANNGADDKNKN